ncbi:zinc finger protein 79 [Brachionichthys hirsutus]|uniref:zinc finger protein 79 n=1 Tax=Brachionichthys hirsutus TaxID=412623 RepID=UPI0036053B59
MDKDKSSDNSQCSWMEMHQLIGDLITPGNTEKDQPDLLTAAWGGAGAAGEVLGLKGASPELLEQPRSSHDKSEAGRRLQPGPPQRKGESRDRRDDVHYSCACPDCPFSTFPPTFENLKPQQALPSLPRSDAAYHRHPTASDAEPSGGTDTLEQEARMSNQPQREAAERGARGTEQNGPHPRAATSSVSRFLIPCLRCHGSLQTCTQVLNPREGAASPFSHTHARHHFHHHHCPLASRLPCPQLVRSHAPQLAGPFSCACCQRSFPACTQERRHQYRQTNAQPQEEREGASASALHPCMHCSASFSRPSQLLQHQHSEHAHKPPGFICTECGRTFNSHSNLRIHLNVHTGARPYACSDCGRSFSQSGALKIHRRIHTGERPYSCGFCGKGFPHLAGVRAHQRTHTGERPYPCLQCGKCFTQSGALKIHTRIHTGERPFVCSFCGKGFSNRSGIRFHHRTVHGLAPEHVEGAGGAARGPAERRRLPGRPRTLHLAKVGLNTSKTPESHRESPETAAAHPGSAVAGGNENKSQSEGGNPGSNRELLLYACEDCGLRFKDAPSRNRHQTLMHYSSGGREEEEEEEEEEGRITHK